MPQTTLEVRVPIHEIDNNPHGSYVNIMLNQKLREAGFPMIGKLFIHGIRHGTLTMKVDNTRFEYVYAWESDPDDEL